MPTGDSALLTQARFAFRPSLKCMTPRATCSLPRNGTSSSTAPSATYSCTKRAMAVAYRMACLRAIGFARHPLHHEPLRPPSSCTSPTRVAAASQQLRHTHTPSMHPPHPRVSLTPAPGFPLFRRAPRSPLRSMRFPPQSPMHGLVRCHSNHENARRARLESPTRRRCPSACCAPCHGGRLSAPTMAAGRTSSACTLWPRPWQATSARRSR